MPGVTSELRRRTIVFDVSGHGYGHLGQVAPIAQVLAQRYPRLRIVVRTANPAALVQDFLGIPVAVESPPPEATLVMRGPSVVDVEASADAYRMLHDRWGEHVDREAARLTALAPALLVADVPYLSLAAAKRAGIPAIALCSLNWLDLYRTYCGGQPEAPDILRTVADAYLSADLFLQPQPHMPMTDLPNRRSIGPVGRIGWPRQAELRAALGIAADERIVLVTLGGIRPERKLALPDVPGIRWLVPAVHAATPDGALDAGRSGMSYIDLLASSDAVLTKIGYCTFVEAACNGVGIVSGPRADWPESRPMIDWARRNANFALAEGGLENKAGVRAALESVLAMPPPAPVIPTGVTEAAGIIARAARLD